MRWHVGPPAYHLAAPGGHPSRAEWACSRASERASERLDGRPGFVAPSARLAVHGPRCRNAAPSCASLRLPRQQSCHTRAARTLCRTGRPAGGPAARTAGARLILELGSSCNRPHKLSGGGNSGRRGHAALAALRAANGPAPLLCASRRPTGPHQWPACCRPFALPERAQNNAHRAFAPPERRAGRPATRR